MNTTTILHEAEVELWEAVAYYEARSPGLGLDFGAEVEASVEAVRDFAGTMACASRWYPSVI